MKAMVLCAGYGTRLGNLVTEIPKPMLPLGDRPILEYTLRHLARHGFHEVAVNLHFQSEVIRNYFGDGSRFHVRLVYSDEPELLGTAGGVKKMAAFLAGSDPFLVHYGDVVTDQDFTAMLHFHRENNALATLLVHQRENSNSIQCLTRASGSSASWSGPTPGSALRLPRLGSTRALPSARPNSWRRCRRARAICRATFTPGSCRAAACSLFP